MVLPGRRGLSAHQGFSFVESTLFGLPGLYVGCDQCRADVDVLEWEVATTPPTPNTFYWEAVDDGRNMTTSGLISLAH